jgi:hypothetical protein
MMTNFTAHPFTLADLPDCVEAYVSFIETNEHPAHLLASLEISSETFQKAFWRDAKTALIKATKPTLLVECSWCGHESRLSCKHTKGGAWCEHCVKYCSDCGEDYRTA